MRNPKRTAASASALMIGVGVVGLITIFVSSTKASMDAAVDRAFTGDIVVDSGGGLFGGVDPGLATRLDRLPEVAVAAGLRQGVAQVAGHQPAGQQGAGEARPAPARRRPWRP
jgi:putative ABC transport system permease protein